MKNTIASLNIKMLIGSMFFLLASTIHASPLNSGLQYANFCNGHVDRNGSAEQLFCIGFFVGTIRGYGLGVTNNILSSMKGDPAVIAKLGEAARNGTVDGYCSPQDKSSNGEKLQVAINTIASNQDLHQAPTHTAIMLALEEAYPCNKL